MEGTEKKNKTKSDLKNRKVVNPVVSAHCCLRRRGQSMEERQSHLINRILISNISFT